MTNNASVLQLVLKKRLSVVMESNQSIATALDTEEHVRSSGEVDEMMESNMQDVRDAVDTALEAAKDDKAALMQLHRFLKKLEQRVKTAREENELARSASGLSISAM